MFFAVFAGGYVGLHASASNPALLGMSIAGGVIGTYMLCHLAYAVTFNKPMPSWWPV
jgi:hypothetical protein